MYRSKMRLISNQCNVRTRRCFVVPSNGPSFEADMLCVGYNLPTLVNWFAKCLTPRKHKFYRTVFWLYKSKMFVILSCETKHYRSVWRNGITMETFHIMCRLTLNYYLSNFFFYRTWVDNWLVLIVIMTLMFSWCQLYYLLEHFSSVSPWRISGVLDIFLEKSAIFCLISLSLLLLSSCLVWITFLKWIPQILLSRVLSSLHGKVVIGLSDMP